jgi:hypothetical protein
VTSVQKLVRISLVQRASNQENDVVDHVGISMRAQSSIRKGYALRRMSSYVM